LDNYPIYKSSNGLSYYFEINPSFQYEITFSIARYIIEPSDLLLYDVSFNYKCPDKSVRRLLLRSELVQEKIRKSIIESICIFQQDKKCSLFYVCDESNGLHKGRDKIFKDWSSEYGHGRPLLTREIDFKENGTKSYIGIIPFTKKQEEFIQSNIELYPYDLFK